MCAYLWVDMSIREILEAEFSVELKEELQQAGFGETENEQKAEALVRLCRVLSGGKDIADLTWEEFIHAKICTLCLESKTSPYDPISCWKCGDSYCSAECADKDGYFHQVDGKTIYSCAFCKKVNIEGHSKFDCIFCQ